MYFYIIEIRFKELSIINLMATTPTKLSQMTVKTPAKQWRAEYVKQYALDHPEETKQAKAKWRSMNRQHSRDYAKQYYATHKENYKKNYEAKKEDLSIKAKEYHKTEKGKRLHTISYWKRRKLVHDDFEQLYKEWITATVCNKCDMPFTERGNGQGSYKCIAKQFGTDEVESICCFRCMNREKIIAKSQLFKSALNICTKPSKTQSVTVPLPNEN